MDAFVRIYRKVYDRTLYNWRGLLCLVVPRVPPRVRGREMVHRRTATGGSIPDLGVVDRLPERALAVGRALILFRFLVARAVAAPLRANLVFTRDGRFRRFQGPGLANKPAGQLARRP